MPPRGRAGVVAEPRAGESRGGARQHRRRKRPARAPGDHGACDSAEDRPRGERSRLEAGRRPRELVDHQLAPEREGRRPPGGRRRQRPGQARRPVANQSLQRDRRPQPRGEAGERHASEPAQSYTLPAYGSFPAAANRLSVTRSTLPVAVSGILPSTITSSGAL